MVGNIVQVETLTIIFNQKLTDVFRLRHANLNMLSIRMSNHIAESRIADLANGFKYWRRKGGKRSGASISTVRLSGT